MRLDLGCGPSKKAGYVGIDNHDWSKIYPKGEFIQGLVPDVFSAIKDGSVEEIRASHFIEHIPQPKVIETFNEIYRILITGGIFEIFVPPTPSNAAWCDPGHVSFWNEDSFRYYDMSWKEKLSKSYGIKCNFKRVKIELLAEWNLHAILQKI